MAEPLVTVIEGGNYNVDFGDAVVAVPADKVKDEAAAVKYAKAERKAALERLQKTKE